MTRFNEKIVVISGAASGMGALTAKRVVEEGGTAITLDINEDLGNKVAKEIGNKCEFFNADVTKPESWSDLENYLGDRFNKVTSVIMLLELVNQQLLKMKHLIIGIEHIQLTVHQFF